MIRRRFLMEIGSEEFNPSRYLTIEPLEDGLTASLSLNDCEYCIDGGEWAALPAGTETPAINVGQIVSFKGNLKPNSSSGIGTFTISKLCNLSGDCMSMLAGSARTSEYRFYKLFKNCITICNVSQKFLRSTVLTRSCYKSMFQGCTSLTQAPELPATTLAAYCYQRMFQGCTSLTKAPELPATNWTYVYVYDSMFMDCTSLIEPPKLSSKSIGNYSYQHMFQGCTSLTKAPELPATSLGINCYEYMFQGCTSLTTAPELPADTMQLACYRFMFINCTSLTQAPELNSKILTSNCYRGMFQGCTSLTQAPELPATRLMNSCYERMFYGCTSLATAPELPATTLADNCYESMFSETIVNFIKMLAIDISADGCLSNWLYGVPSTGTFVKNKDATWDITGASGVPSGWTIEYE